MRNRIFWLLALLFFLGADTLAAVLYAGVDALDSGSGFLSLSPFADILVWGIALVLTGVPALVLWLQRRPDLLRVPGPVALPAAFLALQGVGALLLLALGAAGFLDPYSGCSLPLWGYASLAAALHLSGGFFLGRRGAGRWSWDLLGGAVLAGLFLALGDNTLRSLAVSEAVPLPGGGTVLPRYTSAVMEGPEGALLGRLNLLGGVVLGHYDYAYYHGVHTLDRGTLTGLACLCPPLLFTLGALAGRTYKAKEV